MGLTLVANLFGGFYSFQNSNVINLITNPCAAICRLFPKTGYLLVGDIGADFLLLIIQMTN